jgi:alkanesulfonate monooxygenase SsuD/methylene tetrahydromethanopterin reductase-like flavin-dependent oxidoreductase (luciferase family)
MAIKRLTKADHPVSFGAFSPTGHVVVCFETDEEASSARQDLLGAGFEEEDILLYTHDEERDEMSRLLDGVSGASGFGHEVCLMRLYKDLAEHGSGFLIVYTPDRAHCERVVEIAKKHNAKLAEKYGRLVIEDLI